MPFRNQEKAAEDEEFILGIMIDDDLHYTGDILEQYL